MCGLTLVRSFGNKAEDTSLTLPEPADHFDQYPRRTMYCMPGICISMNIIIKWQNYFVFFASTSVTEMVVTYPPLEGSNLFQGAERPKSRICLHRRGKESRGGTTRYNMNGRFQMQRGKNWIFPKENDWDSHWLEIWSNHLFPSTGPNEGIVAMD